MMNTLNHTTIQVEQIELSEEQLATLTGGYVHYMPTEANAEAMKTIGETVFNILGLILSGPAFIWSM